MPYDYSCAAELYGEKTPDCSLQLGEDGIAVVSPLETAEILYADILSFEISNYKMHIKTQGGSVLFSGLGMKLEPFYGELYAAYNKKTLKSLFISGDTLLETRGEFRFSEDGAVYAGRAVIQVYENCVAVLPPDQNARRIPLCFVEDIKKSGYELTLVLDTGECYSFIRLGYDTEPFERCLTSSIRALREKTAESAKKIDPSLSAAQAAAIAKLIPEGASAPIGALAKIAPSFSAAVLSIVKKSRAGFGYEVFSSLCDEIWIGFTDKISDGEEEAVLMPWIAAAGKDKAAVEFAVTEEESAATFIYNLDGTDFLKRLNRALEAISFRREPIRLGDEELLLPQNAEYKMAEKRCASLLYVRSRFFGRVIHSSEESWKKNIAEMLK